MIQKLKDPRVLLIICGALLSLMIIDIQAISNATSYATMGILGKISWWLFFTFFIMILWKLIKSLFK